MVKYYKDSKVPVNETLIRKYRDAGDKLVALQNKIKNPATIAFCIYHLKEIQKELDKMLSVKLNEMV